MDPNSGFLGSSFWYRVLCTLHLHAYMLPPVAARWSRGEETVGRADIVSHGHLLELVGRGRLILRSLIHVFSMIYLGTKICLDTSC
jgi:hypothetical protein